MMDKPPLSDSLEHRRHYDLATEDADYPEWRGPPRQTYVLCSHPRSGSTLLGEALYFAGGFGCPLEYFHRGFQPILADRWSAPNLDSYRQAVYRHRTDPTGVLSVKLFWFDIEDICRELDPDLYGELTSRPADSMGEGTYRNVQRLLAEIFPNPVFLYLERQDRLRQAISSLVAVQTNRWRSIPGVGACHPPREVEYDYGQILRYLALGDNCRQNWRNFFRVTKTPRREIAYEDLVADYESTMRLLFLQLGRELPPRSPRMNRQAGVVSERIALQFLREHAQRTAANKTQMGQTPGARNDD